MKVLLIKPPEPEKHVDVVGNRVAIHLGLGYIAANLIKNGIDAQIFDANITDSDRNCLVDTILNLEFDLLAISIPYQWSLEESIKLIRRLREGKLKTPIVVGGHPATFYYKELLEKVPELDYVSLGEGEFTILELAQSIQNGGNVETIKGLAFRENDSVIFTGYRKLIDNLDDLPIPVRENMELLIKTQKNAAIPISGSRGCSWAKCSFCDIQTFYHLCEGEQWRGRKPEKIVDEMEYLQHKYNHNIFSFIDDDFFGPAKTRRERIDAFCDEIEQRNLDIKFNVLCNVRDVNDYLFYRLKKVGLYRAFLGVESGVKNTLDVFNKGVSVNKNREAILRVQGYGIGCECGSIFVTPYTTIDELKENTAFWESVNLMSMDQYRDLLIFKGTPLQKRLEAEGKIRATEHFDFDYSFSLDPDVKKLNSLVDIIRNKYMYPYLRRLKRSRLRMRSIIDKHQITSEKADNLLKNIGKMHFKWFNDVFVSVFKELLDEIEAIDESAKEKVIDLKFGPHVAKFESELLRIQEEFEKILKDHNLK